MNEYEQWLLSGDLEVAAALMLRLGRQFTRSPQCTFPAPDGYSSWTDEAVLELLGEMFRKKEGTGFLVNALINAADAGSAERYLLATINNFLKDEAKATDQGKLRSRLETVLSADDRFVRVTDPGHAWALPDFAALWWQGDVGHLDEAAGSVRGVWITSWNTSGPTSGPTKAALTTVIVSVLTAAAAAVADQPLAGVVLRRFAYAIAPDSTVTALPDPDSIDPDPDPDHAYQGVLADVQAAQLYTLLDTEQRAVLPLLSKPAGEVADAWGIGPREAKARMAQVTEIVLLATVDDDHADAVVVELVKLCGPAAS